MIDTHSHLQDELIKDYALAIKNANNVGVNKIVCASSNISNSKLAIKIAGEFDCVYATVGIHPEDANTYNNTSILDLENLAQNKKVVAIGEIGLDYYHQFATKELQKKVFIEQIELAYKLKLPIIIHSREATGDLIDIIRVYKNKMIYGACIHCFNMSLEILKEITSYGLCISIGGLVTFKNAKNVIDIIKNCPLDKLMLETDTPYLAPEPYRGTINEPKNVAVIIQKIAQILEITTEELNRITTQNAERFFNFNK